MELALLDHRYHDGLYLLYRGKADKILSTSVLVASYSRLGAVAVTSDRPMPTAVVRIGV